MRRAAYLRESARLEYVPWHLQACDVIAYQVLSEAGQDLAGTALHPPQMPPDTSCTSSQVHLRIVA